MTGSRWNISETTYAPDYSDENTRHNPTHRMDAAEQHKRLAAAANPLLATVHRPFIEQYTGNSSVFLNNALIKNNGDLTNEPGTFFRTGDQLRKLDRGLKEAIRTAPALPENVHMWSGMGSKFAEHVSKLSEGQELHSHAYISWAIDGAPALGFAAAVMGEDGSTNRHVLHVHAKAGSKGGVYVGGLSTYGSEKEYISDRGRSFRYLGSSKRTDSNGVNWHIHDLDPL